MNIGPVLFIVGRLVQSATRLKFSLPSGGSFRHTFCSEGSEPKLAAVRGSRKREVQEKKKKGGVKDKEGMMMMDCRGNGWGGRAGEIG